MSALLQDGSDHALDFPLADQYLIAGFCRINFSGLKLELAEATGQEAVPFRFPGPLDASVLPAIGRVNVVGDMDAVNWYAVPAQGNRKVAFRPGSGGDGAPRDTHERCLGTEQIKP